MCCAEEGAVFLGAEGWLWFVGVVRFVGGVRLGGWEGVREGRGMGEGMWGRGGGGRVEVGGYVGVRV